MALKLGGITPTRKCSLADDSGSTDLSVGGSRFSGMRTLRMWLGLIALSLFAITLLNSAGAVVPGEDLDSTASFLIVGIVFF